jgi:hypothetical protein
VTRPIPANHGCDAPPPRPQPAPGQRPGFSSLAVPHGGRAHCASSCWSQPALDPTARHASSHRGFRQLCEDSDNCGARAPDACRVCRRSLRSRCSWLPRCALPVPALRRTGALRPARRPRGVRSIGLPPCAGRGHQSHASQTSATPRPAPRGIAMRPTPATSSSGQSAPNATDPLCDVAKLLPRPAPRRGGPPT